MGVEARNRSLARKRLMSALAGVGVVSLAVAGAGAFAANADPSDVAESQGRFLQGSALGVDLDEIVEILYAEAGNPSLPVSSNVGLTAEALNALVIDLGTINLLGDNGLITLGAVEQRADATADGDAFAGSGAVTDEGAIAIDETPDAGFASASITLDSLLDDAGGEDLISELALEIGALAATAAQVDGATPTSEYMIADLGFALETSVVSELSGALTDVLGGLETSIETLLSGAAVGIDLGPLAQVTGSVGVTLPTLSSLITTPITVDGVTIDLDGGTVTVDLVALLASEGIDINSLPANTNLTTYLPEIIEALVDTVDAVVAQFITSLTGAIGNSALTGTLEIALLAGTADIDLSVGGTLLAPDVEVTASAGGIILDTLLALVGGTLDTAELLVEGVLDAAADGLIATLATTLDAATGGIVTAAQPLIEDVLDIVAEIVSLTVNVQPTAAGGQGDLGGTSFTVRALSIGILPTVGATTLATVDLASATVRGTGLAVDVDADTVTDSDSDTDGDADVDTDGDAASDGGGGGLANTGFDGTWLTGLALLLLLTGAGALLARKVAQH